MTADELLKPDVWAVGCLCLVVFVTDGCSVIRRLNAESFERLDHSRKVTRESGSVPNLSGRNEYYPLNYDTSCKLMAEAALTGDSLLELVSRETRHARP